MPLDRDHVTVASRIMLPTYAVVNAAFGYVFITDAAVESAPSLAMARAWLPMDVWGALWLVVAVAMLLSLLRHRRGTFIAALCLNAASWFAWGCLIETAAFTQPNVTLSAGVLPWGWAAANTASLFSLLRGDSSR